MVAPGGIVFRISRPWWVRASAPAGCSPRGPGGVDLFLQGLFLTLTEGCYRINRAHKCEFGSRGLSKIAGRTPEPLHGARGRSGVPLTFCATLVLPFRSEGGVEYARLPSVGASDDISDELLSGKSEWRPVPHSLGVG